MPTLVRRNGLQQNISCAMCAGKIRKVGWAKLDLDEGRRVVRKTQSDFKYRGTFDFLVGTDMSLTQITRSEAPRWDRGGKRGALVCSRQTKQRTTETERLLQTSQDQSAQLRKACWPLVA